MTARSAGATVARRELLALTGLRFVAAAQVFAFHTFRKQIPALPRWLGNVLDSGFVGVDLFFVLSGFILAYSYLPRYRNGHLDAPDFWMARFARVYPVYLFGLVMALPMFVYAYARTSTGETGTHALVTATATLTLLQSWAVPPLIGWNYPGWSLSTEMFFYAVFPWVGRVALGGSNRKLAAMATCSWIATFVVPVAFLALAPDARQMTVHSFNLWVNVAKFNPLGHLPEFTLGVVTGAYFLRRGAALGNSRAFAISAEIVAAVTIVMALVNADRIPFILIHSGMLAPAFALLMLALAVGTGPIAWMLSRGRIVLLGEASYALYILHVPISELWSLIVKHSLLGRLDSSLLIASYTTITLVASVLTLRTIEMPARQWIRGVWERRRAVRRSNPVRVT